MAQTFKKTIIAAFLLFCCSSPVLAASVSIIPSGNPASFSVEGSGMDGVAGIQIDIAYDKSSLATPTVTQGGLVSGAMLAANTTQPGIIKIAIISTRTFSGSGQIATISFASKTGSGGITSISTSMIDSKGSALASSANNSASTDTGLTAGIPFSQPSSALQESTSTTTTTATSTASTTTPTYPGTITLPTDLQQQAAPQPALAPAVHPPANSGEPAAATIAEHTEPSDKQTSNSKAEATPQFIVYKGISERFNLYNGRKDLSAMVALFAKNVVQTVHQEPTILLSDGQSKATLSIDIPAISNSSPSFAVDGGKLISFKQDKQNPGRLIIGVLPDVGTVKTTVIIISGAEKFEYPLTVAPPVKTTLTLDEQGWNRFLKEVGTAKVPLYDLNNDGVRNYVDEFIFVANYLTQKTTQQKPVSPPNKPAK